MDSTEARHQSATYTHWQTRIERWTDRHRDTQTYRHIDIDRKGERETHTDTYRWTEREDRRNGAPKTQYHGYKQTNQGCRKTTDQRQKFKIRRKGHGGDISFRASPASPHSPPVGYKSGHYVGPFLHGFLAGCSCCCVSRDSSPIDGSRRSSLSVVANVYEALMQQLILTQNSQRYGFRR